MSGEITVIHVDDEPSFTDLTKTFLERGDEQFTVRTARNANEGLERLNNNPPDCIISDYDMGQMDGLAFLKTVRTEYPDLPFILFTGKGSEEVASDAIAAGVTDYLQKQSSTDQYEILANRVRNAVERARAQRDRRRHLNAIESAQEGISILNNEGEFVYTNQAYAELYGYDPEELVDEHCELIYRDDDVRWIQEEVLPTVKNEGHWHGTPAGIHADGGTLVEDHTFATADKGELVCTVNSTRRNRRERAIEKLHNTCQALIEAETVEAIANTAVDAFRDVLNMPVNAVYLHDEKQDQLVPVAWTDQAKTIIGDLPTFERGEGIAWTVFETGGARIYDDVSMRPERYNPDTNARGEIILPLGDHGVVMIGSDEAEAFDETDADLARTLATHVTTALDRVGREQMLTRQNERFDEFAHVVSHDLRNPLGVAKARVELAQQERESPHLERATDALERSQALINDLLTLAREDEQITQLEPVELAGLVEHCWKSVKTDQAVLEVEQTPTINADRSRLKQLFENLYRNAVEHGGSDVTVHIGTTDGGFYVADTGPGIPESEREAIFEAGYSTGSEGTGFGLRVVKEIINAHGWGVAVTESEQGGARFEITGVEYTAV